MVTVQEPPPPALVEVRVSTSADDAEEQTTGSVSLTSSDLELVRETTNQTVGMRFVGLDIPRGATILSAYVQFQTDETRSEETLLTVRGQAADNAPVFTTTAYDVSSRPRTVASVEWVPPAWDVVGEAGSAQQTPDISLVVQEVVGRPGWSSGNALVIVVTGSGKRVAESYDGDASGAPLLHVEYTIGG
jgi:hypothetical protein